MNRFCANEAEYHQQIIDSIDRFPEELKSAPGLKMLVWGHEVGLHDAGSGGGNGSADILAVDEKGMVWVIEVKFGSTRELNGPVWRDQLKRYQEGISKTPWADIVHYTESFLKGKEQTKPLLCSVSEDTQGLVGILSSWQKRIGREAVPADELCARMAEALSSGTYGIMVLADAYTPEASKHAKAFMHGGRVAYVIGEPTKDGVFFKVGFSKTLEAAPSAKEFDTVDSSFDAWKKTRSFRCSPDTFAETLCEGARALWLNTLRPGLYELGWSGKAASVKDKSFDAAFDVGGKQVPLLVIGWSDADAKRVARENKLTGGASIKLNPQIRRLFESSDIDFVNHWMRQFHECGWRGRKSNGGDKRWGITPVSADELEKVDGCMFYHAQDGSMDHSGRAGDKESIEAFLRVFAEMVEQLNKRALEPS